MAAAPPAVSAVAPAPVQASAAPAPVAPAASKPNPGNDRAIELGAGALALLALGGAAFGITRRRRRADEQSWDDGTVAVEDEVREPVAEPIADPIIGTAPVAPAIVRHDTVACGELENQDRNMLAPSMTAFGWTPVQQADEQSAGANSTGDNDDRNPGESWVERAERGPSADNPSVSLKKRLKRAHFFEQREREVAEGTAVPVDPDAGLPEALDEPNIETA